MAATPGGDGATKREIQLEIVEDFTSKNLGVMQQKHRFEQEHMGNKISEAMTAGFIQQQIRPKTKHRACQTTNVEIGLSTISWI